MLHFRPPLVDIPMVMVSIEWLHSLSIPLDLKLLLVAVLILVTLTQSHASNSTEEKSNSCRQCSVSFIRSWKIPNKHAEKISDLIDRINVGTVSILHFYDPDEQHRE